MSAKNDTGKTKPKATTKAKKKGGGRPKAVVDWAMVDMFLKAGCPTTEIADAIGISRETLYRVCKRDHKIGLDTYSQQKKSSGKAMLRAKQFDKAMKGDATMLIFLGKSMLGQTDKPQDSGGGSDGANKVQFTIIEELIEDTNYETEEKTDEGVAPDSTSANSDGDQLQGQPESGGSL